jgi:hypothetical protein
MSSNFRIGYQRAVGRESGRLRDGSLRPGQSLRPGPVLCPLVDRLLSRSDLIKVICTINNPLQAALLTAKPDAFLVSNSAAGVNEILPTEWRRVELLPTLSARNFYRELCLVFVPFVHRPKLSALRTTNQAYPIAGLQLIEARDRGIIVQFQNVGELSAIA